MRIWAWGILQWGAEWLADFCNKRIVNLLKAKGAKRAR